MNLLCWNCIKETCMEMVMFELSPVSMNIMLLLIMDHYHKQNLGGLSVKRLSGSRTTSRRHGRLLIGEQIFLDISFASIQL